MTCPPTHMLAEGAGKWQDNLHGDLYAILHNLSDIVDGQVLGAVMAAGLVRDAHGLQAAVPGDFEINLQTFFDLRPMWENRHCSWRLRELSGTGRRCATSRRLDAS